VNRQVATRLAAPAAFLAGVTIAVLIVRSGLGDETTTTVAPRPTVATTSARTTTRRTPTRPKPQVVFVRVEPGGTLDQIALENDTTVERLLTLNPGLDPIALRVGQRVRVR
jgi:hypothetical protein